MASNGRFKLTTPEGEPMFFHRLDFDPPARHYSNTAAAYAVSEKGPNPRHAVGGGLPEVRETLRRFVRLSAFVTSEVGIDEAAAYRTFHWNRGFQGLSAHDTQTTAGGSPWEERQQLVRTCFGSLFHDTLPALIPNFKRDPSDDNHAIPVPSSGIPDDSEGCVALAEDPNTNPLGASFFRAKDGLFIHLWHSEAAARRLQSSLQRLWSAILEHRLDGPAGGATTLKVPAAGYCTLYGVPVTVMPVVPILEALTPEPIAMPLSGSVWADQPSSTVRPDGLLQSHIEALGLALHVQLADSAALSSHLTPEKSSKSMAVIADDNEADAAETAALPDDPAFDPVPWGRVPLLDPDAPMDTLWAFGSPEGGFYAISAVTSFLMVEVGQSRDLRPVHPAAVPLLADADGIALGPIDSISHLSRSLAAADRLTGKAVDSLEPAEVSTLVISNIVPHCALAIIDRLTVTARTTAGILDNPDGPAATKLLIELATSAGFITRQLRAFGLNCRFLLPLREAVTLVGSGSGEPLQQAACRLANSLIDVELALRSVKLILKSQLLHLHERNGASAGGQAAVGGQKGIAAAPKDPIEHLNRLYAQLSNGVADFWKDATEAMRHHFYGPHWPLPRDPKDTMSLRPTAASNKALAWFVSPRLGVQFDAKSGRFRKIGFAVRSTACPSAPETVRLLAAGQAELAMELLVREWSAATGKLKIAGGRRASTNNRPIGGRQVLSLLRVRYLAELHQHAAGDKASEKKGPGHQELLDPASRAAWLVEAAQTFAITTMSASDGQTVGLEAIQLAVAATATSERNRPTAVEEFATQTANDFADVAAALAGGVDPTWAAPPQSISSVPAAAVLSRIGMAQDSAEMMWLTTSLYARGNPKQRPLPFFGVAASAPYRALLIACTQGLKSSRPVVKDGDAALKVAAIVKRYADLLLVLVGLDHSNVKPPEGAAPVLTGPIASNCCEAVASLLVEATLSGQAGDDHPLYLDPAAGAVVAAFLRLVQCLPAHRALTGESPSMSAHDVTTVAMLLSLLTSIAATVALGGGSQLHRHPTIAALHRMIVDLVAAAPAERAGKSITNAAFLEHWDTSLVIVLRDAFIVGQQSEVRQRSMADRRLYLKVVNASLPLLRGRRAAGRTMNAMKELTNAALTIQSAFRRFKVRLSLAVAIQTKRSSGLVNVPDSSLRRARAADDRRVDPSTSVWKADQTSFQAVAAQQHRLAEVWLSGIQFIRASISRSIVERFVVDGEAIGRLVIEAASAADYPEVGAMQTRMLLQQEATARMAELLVPCVMEEEQLGRQLCEGTALIETCTFHRSLMIHSFTANVAADVELPFIVESEGLWREFTASVSLAHHAAVLSAVAIQMTELTEVGQRHTIEHQWFESFLDSTRSAFEGMEAAERTRLYFDMNGSGQVGEAIAEERRARSSIEEAEVISSLSCEEVAGSSVLDWALAIPAATFEVAAALHIAADAFAMMATSGSELCGAAEDVGRTRIILDQELAFSEAQANHENAIREWLRENFLVMESSGRRRVATEFGDGLLALLEECNDQERGILIADSFQHRRLLVELQEDTFREEAIVPMLTSIRSTRVAECTESFLWESMMGEQWAERSAIIVMAAEEEKQRRIFGGHLGSIEFYQPLEFAATVLHPANLREQEAAAYNRIVAAKEDHFKTLSTSWVCSQEQLERAEVVQLWAAGFTNSILHEATSGFRAAIRMDVAAKAIVWCVEAESIGRAALEECSSTEFIKNYRRLVGRHRMDMVTNEAAMRQVITGLYNSVVDERNARRGLLKAEQDAWEVLVVIDAVNRNDEVRQLEARQSFVSPLKRKQRKGRYEPDAIRLNRGTYDTKRELLNRVWANESPSKVQPKAAVSVIKMDMSNSLGASRADGDNLVEEVAQVIADERDARLKLMERESDRWKKLVDTFTLNGGENFMRWREGQDAAAGHLQGVIRHQRARSDVDKERLSLNVCGRVVAGESAGRSKLLDAAETEHVLLCVDFQEAVATLMRGAPQSKLKFLAPLAAKRSSDYSRGGPLTLGSLANVAQHSAANVSHRGRPQLGPESPNRKVARGAKKPHHLPSLS